MASSSSTDNRLTGSRLRGWLREALFLGVLVLAVLSARSSFADHYYVPSGSMLPTVEIRDRLVVNKLAYGLRVPFTELYLMQFEGPQSGDVVVLESPDGGTILLKRVVAIPGDQVEVRGGKLTLNQTEVEVSGPEGQEMEQLGAVLHPVRLTSGGGPLLRPTTLPANHYLVLGDNRGESHDGRAFGLVKREAILGKGLAIYWRGGPTWRTLR